MITPTPFILARLQEAVSLHRQGDIDGAARLYGEILKISPGHFDSLHLLGVIAMQRGQAAEAVELIGRALQTDRKQSAAHNNLGLALRALGRHEEAITTFARATSLKVDNAEAHYNRALTLLDLRRHDEALAGFRKAINLKPDYIAAHINLAVTLIAGDRNEEAVAALDAAMALAPQDADVQHNKGHALEGLRRYDEARDAFNRAIKLNPEHAEAHVALSERLFMARDFDRAWAEYEWRWKTVGMAPLLRIFAQPRLQRGEDVAGKTVLIHAEQGLGDTLLFCRYVPALAARGANVVVEVQPPLKRVLTTLDGVADVLTKGEALPDFDLHASLLSLPHLLGHDICAKVPYLAADATLMTEWHTKLGERTKLRAGLVWTGSAAARMGRRRNIPLSTLKPLDDGHVEWIGLQPDVHEDDEAALRTFVHLKNHGPTLDDFADTAALVMNLDLVVTVDTAVAHLAGALGKTVWVLLPYAPDWRWLSGNGPAAPWYPTARLFRQPALHDWDSVVAEVGAALKAF